MWVRKWHIEWIGWQGPFFSKGSRFNGGGYLYGASPYKYIRIGPFIMRKYF